MGENPYWITLWKVKPRGRIYTAVQYQPVDKRKEGLFVVEVRFWSFFRAVLCTSGSVGLHQHFPSNLLALLRCYDQQNPQGCCCKVSHKVFHKHIWNWRYYEIQLAFSKVKTLPEKETKHEVVDHVHLHSSGSLAQVAGCSVRKTRKIHRPYRTEVWQKKVPKLQTSTIIFIQRKSRLNPMDSIWTA